MKISKKGLDFIKKHEGLAKKVAGMIHAYPDIATGGEPFTIGYGNTFYEDGTKVKNGDIISLERAEELLRYTVDSIFGKGVDEAVTSAINQNQFDALCSFAYNVGVGALKTSTLLKRVNRNPQDPDIRVQFGRWNRGGGRILAGLVRRRKEEADLYFNGIQEEAGSKEVEALASHEACKAEIARLKSSNQLLSNLLKKLIAIFKK